MSGKPVNTGRIAATARRCVAAVCFALIVIELTIGTTSAIMAIGWVSRVQLVEVILGVSVPLILFWVVLTLIFGRIYCSTVCPMGTLMDIFARLPRLSRRAFARRPYHHLPPRNGLRYGWLALIVAAALLQIPVLLAVFGPYSAFCNIYDYLIRPLVDSGSMGTAIFGAASGIVVAAGTLIAVAVVSTLSGRTLCDTVCPAGAALGLLSRHSVYGIDINTDLCTGCNRCQDVCKSHCIDMNSHTVDNSRCCVCFDCIEACDNRAISYTRRRHKLSIPMLMRVSGPQTSAGINAPTDLCDNNTETTYNDETIS